MGEREGARKRWMKTMQEGEMGGRAQLWGGGRGKVRGKRRGGGLKGGGKVRKGWRTGQGGGANLRVDVHVSCYCEGDTTKMTRCIVEVHPVALKEEIHCCATEGVGRVPEMNLKVPAMDSAAETWEPPRIFVVGPESELPGNVTLKNQRGPSIGNPS